MNSKRQTIWLVSMLSLMVVLSAYYLFTEDASKLNTTKDASQVQEVKIDTTQTTLDSQATTDKTTGGVTADKTKTQTTAETKTSSEATTKQLTDAEILAKITQQGQTSEDYIISQQLQRNENLANQTDSLLKIINDSKQNTEAVSKAYDDLHVIQTRTEKINVIEEELTKDYPNVLVTENANKYKVVLQEKTLERSQAVSIIDLVTNELNIGADSISIQYMP
jgi:stage III sporulation protein AH